MSYKADIECLNHALDQIEYAKSGGAFTFNSSEKLYAVLRLLRQVIAVERTRRKRLG